MSLQVKRLLVRGNGEGKGLQVHQRLLAGSTAGVIAQTTIYPMEVSLSLSVIATGVGEAAGMMSVI